jgi:LA2681-like HEPN
MNLTFEEILNNSDLNKFEPSEVVNILGIIFETSRERENVESLKKGLFFAEKQKLDKFDDNEKMYFHYFVSNGWHYLQRLTQELNSKEFWQFEFEELEKQIINLRSAVKYSENVDDNNGKSQIFTNLGNLFDHLGRFSEAQQYWQKALSFTKEFPLAIGNIGFALISYAKILYDTGQQSLFFKLAYKYLNKSLHLEMYKEAKDEFKNSINELETYFNKENLSEIPNLSDYKLGKTKGEIHYRQWCLSNRLFLNPLNDILTENIASHDYLFLPSIVLQIDQSKIYHSMFNQIKQEFVSARFLLFESFNTNRIHFSDRANLQMDTLDYSTYSLSLEKMKIAFRICYSLFDKIGYFLNEYLNLGFKPNKVSFRSIWYEYEKREIVGLNSKITNTQNWAFRGLYWLSKDLYEKKDLIFKSLIEPDAQEISIIRNYIEHKSFKIVEFGESGLFDNDLTYVVSRDEFELKTLKLIKLVRAAIIYLSLGINLEERKKVYDGPVLPINITLLDDEFKY